MRASEMILQLLQLQKEVGDVEVLITDGYSAACYRGDYCIQIFEDGAHFIDIGIGNCRESD